MSVEQEAKSACLQTKLIACEECGLVVDIPDIKDGQKATCPRCGHTLLKKINNPYHKPIAYGIACLIMLVLSVSFPFMSFSVQGLTHEITLANAAEMLRHFDNGILSALFMGFVLVLPAFYVLAIMYLNYQAAKIHQGHYDVKNIETIKSLCRIIFKIEPWTMVDVFLIGVLVSLVKIAALADVGLGSSFWAFCAYTILFVKCVSLIDRTWLWDQFIPMTHIAGVKPGDDHSTHNHVACHTCNQLNPMPTTKHAKCLRCDSRLHVFDPRMNLQRAWAFLIASIVFYIPANLYPMMYTVSLGQKDGSTIMGGVALLWHLGSYPVAAVIFFASIMIPMAKMFALMWLYYSASKKPDCSQRDAIQHLKLYRITELIGRWSMIDIFVVSILVALVQLQNLMAILPGPAALSFAAVVVFTMLSAMTFDPRVFWSNTDLKSSADGKASAAIN
ncbi:paraquat-inducible protein A [Photobacterium damselae]|uniref:paraquat-inducible protein A n=1 Tax=Photobacterium damselae TaxID=38293 RepID=UPI002F42DFC2